MSLKRTLVAAGLPAAGATVFALAFAGPASAAPVPVAHPVVAQAMVDCDPADQDADSDVQCDDELPTRGNGGYYGGDDNGGGNGGNNGGGTGDGDEGPVRGNDGYGGIDGQPSPAPSGGILPTPSESPGTVLPDELPIPGNGGGDVGPDTLPLTGAPVGVVLAVGGGLLLAGGAALVAARRRRA